MSGWFLRNLGQFSFGGLIEATSKFTKPLKRDNNYYFYLNMYLAYFLNEQCNAKFCKAIGKVKVYKGHFNNKAIQSALHGERKALKI